MATIKTCNIDDWRLGTGGTDRTHYEDIYKDINQPVEKTYLTKPYTLKRRPRDREEQKP